MSDSEDLCYFCRYYACANPLDVSPNLVDGDPDNVGECRRYAPRPNWDRNVDFVTEWAFPAVSAYSWCGQFKKRNGDLRLDDMAGRNVFLRTLSAERTVG